MTAKQQAFVNEYLIDLNATQAAIRAGYSAKTAYSIGQRLLKHVEVAAAVVAATAERQKRTEITQDWVVERLVENVDRAMVAEPVRDREGNPVGDFTYQGAVANGSLKLLGQHLGMFTDRVEVSGNLEVENPDVVAAVERFEAVTVAAVRAANRAGTSETDGGTHTG